MRTRCRTFLSIPSVCGVSSRSTVRPIRPSPSARSVPRCFCDWPIWLRVCVIFSFAILGNGWRCLLCGNSLALLSLSREQDFVDRLAAHPRDVLRAAQALEPVDRRLEQVDRIRVPQALGENVTDPGELEDGADSAARDDAGSLARRAEQHACRVRATEDLVRDRRAALRHLEEVLLGVVDGLGDG